jgi:hypothetical protein
VTSEGQEHYQPRTRNDRSDEDDEKAHGEEERSPWLPLLLDLLTYLLTTGLLSQKFVVRFRAWRQYRTAAKRRKNDLFSIFLWPL